MPEELINPEIQPEPSSEPAEVGLGEDSDDIDDIEVLRAQLKAEQAKSAGFEQRLKDTQAAFTDVRTKLSERVARLEGGGQKADAVRLPSSAECLRRYQESLEPKDLMLYHEAISREITENAMAAAREEYRRTAEQNQWQLALSDPSNADITYEDVVAAFESTGGFNTPKESAFLTHARRHPGGLDGYIASLRQGTQVITPNPISRNIAAPATGGLVSNVPRRSPVLTMTQEDYDRKRRA